MFSWETPSIGPALEGSEVGVMDSTGGFVDEGVSGELVVRGHSTMSGYYLDPENTARSLDGDGWLHTGDEGCFRVHEGQRVFFVTGRMKEIIIRDAEKYGPLGLERRVVEALPELAGHLVVVGFPHHAHGEEVGAYVEIDRFDAVLQARLTAALQTIPMAARPKVILHGTQAIPRTHTGKIQRGKMRAWFAAFVEHRGPVVVASLSPDAVFSS
jgi:long-chain acyl-CoA synthetase